MIAPSDPALAHGYEQLLLACDSCRLPKRAAHSLGNYLRNEALKRSTVAAGMRPR